jgi:NAD-dependent dihydropyrimidine dehydrogenase PreA subunit
VTYVITRLCIDCVDTSCADVCPLECIYARREDAPNPELWPNQLYLNPDECIDCGNCEPACPWNAIFEEDEVPAIFGDDRDLNYRIVEEMDHFVPAHVRKHGCPSTEEVAANLAKHNPTHADLSTHVAPRPRPESAPIDTSNWLTAGDLLKELERRFPAPAGTPKRAEPYDWESNVQPISIVSEISERDPDGAALVLSFQWSAGLATVIEDFNWVLAFEDGRELVDFLCIVGAGLIGHTEFNEFPEMDDDEADEEEEVCDVKRADGTLNLSEKLLSVWRHRVAALEPLAAGGDEPQVSDMLDTLGELLGGSFEGP